MTARQQIRVGRRLGRDRAPVDATPAPGVGDLLHAAREKKGVDLYRAERDTKIRARHLAALESGDYAELPGSVYVKGFLRNYATYLGLDPVEALERWHEEQDPGQRVAATAAVGVPPQPLADPRRGLTFTPGVLVAVVLSLVVVGFLGYVALQLTRFSQTPELSLSVPAYIQLPLGSTTVTLSGNAPVQATVDATDGSGRPAGSTVANDEGIWAMDLTVRRGQNDFTLVTRDPETGRDAPPRQVMVVVAVPEASMPAPTPAPTAPVIVPGVEPTIAPVDASLEPGASAVPEVSGSPAADAAQLELSSPGERSTSKDPAVTVKGRTDARAVRISATWEGSGKRPGNPGTVQVDVRRGAFSRDIALAPGRWAVTVETVATDSLSSTTLTRSVEVDYQGFVVEVAVKQGRRAWIQVTVDGRVLDAGGVMSDGDRRIVRARESVIVRTGVERNTLVGVQGARPEQLGPTIGVGVWRVDKGKAPTRLQGR
ncbi:MAG: helix-turn-helix domain-containing protein [Chloroflexi bacterium]|nr:helix-turn-helix domain-containing protein [Chloroflexota bacterium]